MSKYKVTVHSVRGLFNNPALTLSKNIVVMTESRSTARDLALRNFKLITGQRGQVKKGGVRLLQTA